jgi:hypothetical protein
MAGSARHCTAEEDDGGHVSRSDGSRIGSGAITRLDMSFDVHVNAIIQRDGVKRSHVPLMTRPKPQST